MEFIKIEVARREAAGTRSSRKIRGEGRVPAVLYGLGRENASISIGTEAFEEFLATGSKLVELKPGQELKLKAGMHFTSHPPRGQSS